MKPSLTPLAFCIAVLPVSLFADNGQSTLDALMARKLNLRTDDGSTVESFQVEFFIRGIAGQRPTGARFLLERDGPTSATVVQSEVGVPKAIFRDGLFIVVDDAQTTRVKRYVGAPYCIQCGTNTAGGEGISCIVGVSPKLDSTPEILVDIRGMIQATLDKNPTISFVKPLRKLCLRTPKGTVTEITLKPEWRNGRFPIESVVTSTRAGHLISIFVLHSDSDRLQSVIRADGARDRIAGAVVARVEDWNKEFPWLYGAPMHQHPQARRTGLKLANTFLPERRWPSISQSRQDLEGLIAKIVPHGETGLVADALAKLQRVLENEIVVPELGAGHHGVYSRQAAAHRFEITFGPVLRRQLDDKIREIVLSDRYDVAVQCRVLSILGCIGVAVYSRTLDDIAVELKKKPNADLECVFAAVKLLNGHISDGNVDQLHRAVENSALSIPARLCAVEALGLVDDIAGHSGTIEKLLSVPPGHNDQLALNRCARVLARTSVGRKILSERVHSTAGTDALQLPYLSELLFAMEQDDFRAKPLVEIAEAVALNGSESPDNRCLAATAVYGGGITESFALKYAKQAFGGNNHQIKRSAVGALLLAVRQADVSYPYIQQSLGSTDAELRQGAAAAFVSLLRFGKSNATSQTFHKMLHQIFEHEDAEVAYFGIVAIHELSQQGVKPPKYYLPKVERVLARVTDRDKVIMGVAAIQKYSDGALSLDFKGNQSHEDIEEMRREALRWARQHRKLN